MKRLEWKQLFSYQIFCDGKKGSYTIEKKQNDKRVKLFLEHKETPFFKGFTEFFSFESVENAKKFAEKYDQQ